MRSFIAALSTAVLAPILGLAAPAGHDGLIARGENLCRLKAPPALCAPDASVTAKETAERAYKFYKAFVVDGDPAAMFSYIDSSYIVSQFSMVLAVLYGTSARDTNRDSNHSNTTPATEAVLLSSGPFSAAATRPDPRPTARGASMPAPTCPTHDTPR